MSCLTSCAGLGAWDFSVSCFPAERFRLDAQLRCFFFGGQGVLYWEALVKLFAYYLSNYFY